MSQHRLYRMIYKVLINESSRGYEGNMMNDRADLVKSLRNAQCRLAADLFFVVLPKGNLYSFFSFNSGLRYSFSFRIEELKTEEER